MGSISQYELPSDKLSKEKEKEREMAPGEISSSTFKEIARPRFEVPPYTSLTEIRQKPSTKSVPSVNQSHQPPGARKPPLDRHHF